LPFPGPHHSDGARGALVLASPAPLYNGKRPRPASRPSCAGSAPLRWRCFSVPIRWVPLEWRGRASARVP